MGLKTTKTPARYGDGNVFLIYWHYTLVLTKRKSGYLRLCIDFRILNKITLRDNYPFPLIDDQIDALGGKVYFSLLDLKNAFHDIDVTPESIKLTLFFTPISQYEYLKMPFALKTAPDTFQRFINSASSDLIKTRKVIVYLDDVMVATETIEEQIEVLIKVFIVMSKNKMEVK